MNALAALALLLAALLPGSLAQAQFSAAEVAAAKPWHFVTKEEGQARAHRLRKAHPALRRQLFSTWTQDFGKTYKSPAHQVRAAAAGAAAATTTAHSASRRLARPSR